MSSEPIEPPAPGRLEFSQEELLSNVPYEEPLFAGDVRCHGGFTEGRYISPRTLVRQPAIEAWQQRLRDERDPLVHLPEQFIPPHYPNFEQAKLLMLEGVGEPIVRSLTTISIVEGFGAMVRELPVPDLKQGIVEDVGGTALSHVGAGLFEAHARDEAGHRSEGGHKQMWEAARDLGLSKPEIPGDVLMRMMMGRGGRRVEPLFPELIPHMEAMITAMANVMVVEIFADGVFDWGERLLGDPEVSADPDQASAMVSYIRSDEKPHVEYLRTALSELRARTLLTTEGRQIPGREVIDRIFERQLHGMASERPREARDRVRAELRDAIEQQTRMSTDLMRRFDALDSGWVFPDVEEPVELITS